MTGGTARSYNRHMKLLTKALQDTIPALGKGDGTAVVKFFDPCGSWTWYVQEGAAIVDGSEVPLKGIDLAKAEDVLFFGLVDGFEKELGYFTLSELESVKGPLGIGLERDLYWTPKKV